MVRAVQQEGLDQGRISRHKTTAHAGHVAALGETGEGDQVLVVAAAELVCSLQAAQRRLVAEVDLAVALVRGNHKTIPVAQFKQLLPLRQRHDGAGGVARGTNKKQLRPLPHGVRHRVPILGEIACRVAGRVIRGRARQQGCTFIDLVERIGADYQRLAF
ncbi:hypothetical protein D3C71_1269250 [compost metagenome]